MEFGGMVLGRQLHIYCSLSKLFEAMDVYILRF